MITLPFISLRSLEATAAWQAATADLHGRQLRLSRSYCLLVVGPAGESVVWQW